MNQFVMKQQLASIGNNYIVYNQNRDAVYIISGGHIYAFLDRLLGGLCGISHEVTIKDNEDNCLLTVEKKYSGIYEEFEIKQNHELIATAIKEKTLLMGGITIVFKDRTYLIKADIFGSHFSILDECENELVNIKKFVITLRDAYEITILVEMSKPLIFALVYIVDSSYHN